ncbi:protein sip-5 [Luteimonas sp. TWI1416]|uniref:protein sip-5 n=1 Tax=unclassified Luteimonas TaxID=2629088 RepID=UPI0032083A08
MNFEGLKTRVERAEALVDGRVVQTLDRHAALRSSWREAWTPSRIVIAGLIGGFAMGVSQPKLALRRLGKLGGPKSLQMVSALSGLASSIQATIAAVTAKQAADAADASEEAATDAATETTSPAAGVAATATARGRADGVAGAGDGPSAESPTDRRRPEPAYAAQPRPAEAATEVSESGR